MRLWFLYGLTASLLLASSCVVVDDDGDDDENGEAGESSTGGKESTGGAAGDSGATSTGGKATTGGSDGGGGAGDGGMGDGGATDGGAPPSATGGKGGSGGSGGAGTAVDCSKAELLPEQVTEDLEIGPGCVRVGRSSVYEGAKLTIAAGTTVQFEPAGYLDVENGGLSAKGTAAAPIVFTSASDSPTPGDWQCVFLDGSSSDVDIENAIFEYGGDDCDANGAGHEGMLTIGSAARAVSNSTFRHSVGYGVKILADGNVRAFKGNHFAGNQQPSINVSAPQLLQLGEGLTFDDDGDFILIDTTFALDASGNWLSQPVPFHAVGGLSIHDMAEVTMDAGVTLKLDGSSFEVFNANLIVAGTEAAPVTFTSSFDNPSAGDWGCLVFSSPTGTPRFDHAVFEYAGNGQGCTGASYNGALVVPDAAVIRDTTFRNIDGFAIRASECNVDDWCQNTFESVATGPLSCDSPEVLTACP